MRRIVYLYAVSVLGASSGDWGLEPEAGVVAIPLGPFVPDFLCFRGVFPS